VRRAVAQAVRGGYRLVHVPALIGATGRPCPGGTDRPVLQSAARVGICPAPLVTPTLRGMESTDVELLKAHLGALLDVVAGGSRLLVQLANGRSVVLLSADELASLEETLAVMQDPELMADLAQPPGEYVPIEQALEELRRPA
jgi:antitoxin YefM